MSGGGFNFHGPNDYRLEADGLPASVNATALWTYTLPHPTTCYIPS